MIIDYVLMVYFPMLDKYFGVEVISISVTMIIISGVIVRYYPESKLIFGCIKGLRIYRNSQAKFFTQFLMVKKVLLLTLAYYPAYL